MGTMMNIILMMFVINVFIYVVPEISEQAELGFFVGDTGRADALRIFNIVFNGTAAAAGFAIIGASAGLLGLATNNQWLLFAGVVVAMASLITSPLVFIASSGFPAVIQLLMSGFFVISYVIALMEFYRGYSA